MYAPCKNIFVTGNNGIYFPLKTFYLFPYFQVGNEIEGFYARIGGFHGIIGKRQ